MTDIFPVRTSVKHLAMELRHKADVSHLHPLVASIKEKLGAGEYTESQVRAGIIAMNKEQEAACRAEIALEQLDWLLEHERTTHPPTGTPTAR